MTKYNEYFLPVYNRKELNIIKADGSYLYTDEGKYLDMIAALGVNVLGSANKRIISAIEKQANRYMHISNFYESDIVGEYAKYLCENTFADKIFFSNSGTESIEAGLKIIKKYGKQNNKDIILSFSKGYHGRSLGSLSVTSKTKIKDTLEPLIPGIKSIEFNNINDIIENINERCAGIIIETVQGQGGVNIADKEFILKIRELTEKFGAVLLIDEIQSGIGRTGKFFSFEHYGIEPDLVASAKSLGGGLPLGALLVNKKYSQVLEKGDHGSTFGGNPVSCAAGLELVKQVNDEVFLSEVREKADKINYRLKKIRELNTDTIGEIKQLGMMIGIELKHGADKVTSLFEKEGVIVNVTGGNVLRLLPPLTLSYDEIDIFFEKFELVLNAM
ncbi:MAG: acetylornithine transaminase [Candidatus Delongbacteria bacterium]|jgi:acetylornithine/N-succinyldiaminopimelate aminotransferase|nr:acetylornithine transaminase [Candidatus Delongbacteria bacterium]